MLRLTVILCFSTAASAIRVPTAWPEQATKPTKVSDLHTQQPSIVHYADVPTNNRIRIRNNQQHQQLQQHQPKKSATGSNRSPIKRGNAKLVLPDTKVVNSANLKSQNDKVVLRPSTNGTNDYYLRAIINNQRDTAIRHNNLESLTSLLRDNLTNDNDLPSSTEGWVPITGHSLPRKVKPLRNPLLPHNIVRKHNRGPNRKGNHPVQIKSSHKLTDAKINSGFDDVVAVPVKTKFQREGNIVIPQDDRILSNDPRSNRKKFGHTDRQIYTRPSDPSKWALRGQNFHSFQTFFGPQRAEANDNPLTNEISKPTNEDVFGIFPILAPSSFYPKYEDDTSRPNTKPPNTYQKHIDDMTEKIRTSPKVNYFDAFSTSTDFPLKQEEIQNKHVVKPLGIKEDDSGRDEPGQNDDDEDDDEEEDVRDDFVPMKVFAQVRQNENEEYLPSSLVDDRLRESIKDSKIHTVYTEEGFEDVAYDHGGREKNKESKEGNVHFDKDVPRDKKRRFKPPKEEIDVLKEFEKYDKSGLKNEEEEHDEETHKNEDNEDSDTSASNLKNVRRYPNNFRKSNFGIIKEDKVTKIANINDGDMELEITSEVKVMTKPNNVSTAHKFVKIVPKSKENLIKRVKRESDFVIDYPKVNVQAEFLDDLQNQTDKYVVEPATVKYPYYKFNDSQTLNKISPLRYAEDLKRIPQKVFGEMSFYEQSKISECPTVPDNVDPVKEREEREGEDSEKNLDSSTPKTPRLSKLGEKIDCLKAKLFGENPLDSPIFQEDSVEQPISIFDELKAIGSKIGQGDSEEENKPKLETDENYRQAKSAEIESVAVNGTEIETTTQDSSNNTLPESAALHVVHRRRRKPQTLHKRAFIVGRYVPSNSIPQFKPPQRPTKPPRSQYQQISEVFYKEDIKPNEQFNVFADVMNNIKSAYQDQVIAESADSIEKADEYSNKEKRKNKVPSRKVRNKNQYKTIRESLSVITTTSTTPKPKRRFKTKYKNHKPELVYEDYGNTVKPNEDEAVESASEDVYLEEVDYDVVGLSPPKPDGPYSYNLPTKDKMPLNTFLVAGMRPPSSQLPVSYAEFRMIRRPSANRRGHFHRIYKRSSNKPNYSEIRRNRPTEASIVEHTKPEEIEDDYMPQRHRNFYYDVGTGQVVYTGNESNKEEDEDEDEEEVKSAAQNDDDEDDGEDYLYLPKATTQKPILILTTEKHGPSFIEFVQDLQGQNSYVPIQKPEEMKRTTTEKPVVDLKPQSGPTEVPQFFKFVENLKSNENYSEIPQKKKITTTVKPQLEEEEEDEEEEKQLDGVKTYGNMQIFDISSYLPEPENVKPKPIDFSKYKTISRTPQPVKNTVNSRYSSEESQEAEPTMEPTENTEVTTQITHTAATSATTVRTTTGSVLKRVRVRGRRPTTISTTTTSPTITRNRNKRRSRPTTTTTTESTVTSKSSVPPIIRRRISVVRRHSRNEDGVPANHKEVYTPLIQPEKLKRVRKLTNTKEVSPVGNDASEQESEGADKKEQIEIFHNFNVQQMHGGNYRREVELAQNDEEAVSSNVEDIQDDEETRLTDVVPKPVAFYSDPTLPETVNLLKDKKVERVVEDFKIEVKDVENSSEVVLNNDKYGEKDGESEDDVKNISGETVTLKPVNIVKDPSKRLYYYVA